MEVGSFHNWAAICTPTSVGGATTYDLSDRLGSATRKTYSTQATTATRTYDAFGALLSTSGTPQGPFGFAGGHGYQEDGDSGLKLLGHRYYDPSVGRFLTRDHAQDGRNWYAYGANNPTRYVDPNGHFIMVVYFGVGLLVGAVTAAIAYFVDNKHPITTGGQSGSSSTSTSSSPQPNPQPVGPTFAPDSDPNDPIIYHAPPKNKTAETLATLSNAARRADESIDPSPGYYGHGVSGSSGVPPEFDPNAPGVPQSVLNDNGFPIRHTPTKRNPNHVTILLPKPVTEADVNRFDHVYGFR